MAGKVTSSDAQVDDSRLFVGSSSLTEQERKDILSEIDKIVDENKIAVTEDLFKLSPRKRGGVFPVMLNLIMYALVAGGVYYAFQYFNVRQENLSLETNQYFSTEGKLIEELKKDSESKLKKKDEEIGRIKGELDQLDKQSEELRQSMDLQIKTKEDQLRKTLAAELEKERERLQSLGTSQADIDAQIAVLEEKKKKEFDGQLQQFRDESEARIAEKEKELQQAKSLANEVLNKANREKESLKKETMQREAELTAQFAKEKAALETETSEAEQKLKELSDIRSQEQLISDQINGAYSEIIKKIDNEDNNGAESDLFQLESLLNDPKLANIPSIANRKEIELFHVKVLRESIEGKTATQDTSSLVDAANLLLSARELAVKGKNAQDKGDIDEASRLYSRALSQIPSVSNAYTNLGGIEEKKKSAVLSSSIRDGWALLDEGKAADALAQYRNALVGIYKGDTTLMGNALDGMDAVYRAMEKEQLDLKDASREQLQNRLNREIRIRTQRITSLQKEIALREKESAEYKEEALAKDSQLTEMKNQLVLAEAVKADIESMAGKYSNARQTAERLLDSEITDNFEKAKKLLTSVFSGTAGEKYFPGLSDNFDKLEAKQVASQLEEAKKLGRDSALRDILRFVDYLSGLGISGREKARIEIMNQTGTDILYKTTIEGIQSLSVVSGGMEEKQVQTAQEKLLGTVFSVASGEVTVERLVDIDVKKDAIVLIKRKSLATGEVSIATGIVKNVDGEKITAKIQKVTNMDQPPMIMDLVYLSSEE